MPRGVQAVWGNACSLLHPPLQPVTTLRSSLPPPPALPCTGSTSTGYRVLATPCLTDAVPATSAALYAHPQLFRVNNDLYDGSYLNFMSTMQAPGLTTFTCLTTCT